MDLYWTTALHEKVAVISKTMSDIKEQSCNSLRALGDTVKRKTMERLSTLGGGGGGDDGKEKQHIIEEEFLG